MPYPHCFSNLKSLNYCCLLSVHYPNFHVFCVKAYWQSLQTPLPKGSNSLAFLCAPWWPAEFTQAQLRFTPPPLNLPLLPAVKESRENGASCSSICEQNHLSSSGGLTNGIYAPPNFTFGLLIPTYFPFAILRNKYPLFFPKLNLYFCFFEGIPPCVRYVA